MLKMENKGTVRFRVCCMASCRALQALQDSWLYLCTSWTPYLLTYRHLHLLATLKTEIK